MKTRFVDLTDRIIYLRSIPVTTLLPPPVVRIIASYMHERFFPAGTILMREGDPIPALHLLTEGQLQLVTAGTPVGKLAPPQSLGFLGILARAEGQYTATVESDVRTLELAADSLLELMEDHPSLLQATIRYLAERDLYEVQELPPEIQEKRLTGREVPMPERNLRFIERLLYLRGLSAFRRSNLNAVSMLARQLVEVRFAPGERIWTAGEHADHQLWVVSGMARCTMGDKMWRAGGESVLGGLEAIAEQPRWYTLDAETPFLALRSTSSGFFGVIEDDFSMASDFITVLARDLSGLLQRRAQLGQSSVGVMRNVSKLGNVPVGA